MLERQQAPPQGSISRVWCNGIDEDRRPYATSFKVLTPASIVLICLWEHLGWGLVVADVSISDDYHRPSVCNTSLVQYTLTGYCMYYTVAHHTFV